MSGFTERCWIEDDANRLYSVVFDLEPSTADETDIWPCRQCKLVKASHLIVFCKALQHRLLSIKAPHRVNVRIRSFDWRPEDADKMQIVCQVAPRPSEIAIIELRMKYSVSRTRLS